MTASSQSAKGPVQRTVSVHTTRLMSLPESRKAARFVVANSATVVMTVGEELCEVMGVASGKSRKAQRESCRQSRMALRCRANEHDEK